MLTKMKIALVLAGSLVCGVAAAQGNANSGAQKDFKAAREARKAEMLKKYDTNRDGKLDESERKTAYDANMSEQFKALDTDGNGVLTIAEFKAGKKQMHHRRGGHGKHRMGGKAPGATK